MSFEQVLSILDEISKTPSINKKREIIASNRLTPAFRNTAVFAYHPLLQFNLLSIPGNYAHLNGQGDYKKIFSFLRYLSSKRGVTNQERDELDSLCISPHDVELVNRILNKDLRCGAGPTLFGQTFDIPNPEPMLCEDDLEKMVKKVEGDIGRLVWSVKLDGVRTRAILEGPDSPVKYISRNGKAYTNFYVFDASVAAICCAISVYLGDVWPITLDGEVISKDKDFQKQMTQVHRLSEADPSIFEFQVFDFVPPPVNNLEKMVLFDRLGLLEAIMDEESFSDVKLLLHSYFPQETTVADILSMVDHLCEQGEEGAVIKDIESFYTPGRSWEWTKVKRFHTEDLKVVGKEEGAGKHKGRLGALIVERTTKLQGGSVTVFVKVGSGYSDEERDEFWSSPPQLIEVKYQNVTKDGSLRFPVFVRVREDKRVE